MAKSRMYTKRIAKHITVTLTPFDCASAPKMPRKPCTISLAQAKPRRDTMVAMAPAIIKGCRFPHATLQLSLRIPMYGWTKVPDRGPAIHTKASRDLLIPSDNKYGYITLQSLRSWEEALPNNLTDPLESSTAHAICSLDIQKLAKTTKQEQPPNRGVGQSALTLQYLMLE